MVEEQQQEITNSEHMSQEFLPTVHSVNHQLDSVTKEYKEKLNSEESAEKQPNQINLSDSVAIIEHPEQKRKQFTESDSLGDLQPSKLNFIPTESNFESVEQMEDVTRPIV